jgi:hypothetical protein
VLELLVTHVFDLLDGVQELPFHVCVNVDFTQLELLGAVPQLIDFPQLGLL